MGRVPTTWEKRQRWEKRPLYHLSPRQADVLYGFWKGETEKETAVRLGITPRMVQLHRRLARAAMYSPTTIQAARRAVKERLIPSV